MQLNTLIDMFLREKAAACAPRTYEYYKEYLARFAEFVYERNIIDADFIKKTDYIDYIAMLRGTGVKNITVRTYCRPVSVFSNWLVDNELLAASFTNRVKLPKKDAAIIIPLSMREVTAVDEAVALTEEALRNSIIVHLMLDCGLRKKEVINLKCKDINKEDKYVVINNGKGNKSRIVPLPESLLELIEMYKPERIKHRYLLASGDGQPITDNAVKLMFYKIKLKSGIERLKPHLLRHTFATSFILGGGNLEMLRVLMGHSDYTITQTYLHIAAQAQVLGTEIYRLDDTFFRNYNNFKAVR